MGASWSLTNADIDVPYLNDMPTLALLQHKYPLQLLQLHPIYFLVADAHLDTTLPVQRIATGSLHSCQCLQYCIPISGS